jgi:hypothetical protein
MEDLKSNVRKEGMGFAEEKTSSPEIFMDRFLKSDLFIKGIHGNDKGGVELRGYADFVEELESRKVDATEEEIRRVFLGMNEAKLLLLYFAKHELMFEFDEKAFENDGNGVYREFGRYRALVERNNLDRTKMELDSLPVDIRRTRIVEMDAERQFRHTQALNALYDGGYVPSKMIGRAVARIMLISEGLDTFERVQYDEEQRFKMLARASNSRI